MVVPSPAVVVVAEEEVSLVEVVMVVAEDIGEQKRRSGIRPLLNLLSPVSEAREPYQSLRCFSHCLRFAATTTSAIS